MDHPLEEDSELPVRAGHRREQRVVPLLPEAVGLAARGEDGLLPHAGETGDGGQDVRAYGAEEDVFSCHVIQFCCGVIAVNLYSDMIII